MAPASTLRDSLISKPFEAVTDSLEGDKWKAPIGDLNARETLMNFANKMSRGKWVGLAGLIPFMLVPPAIMAARKLAPAVLGPQWGSRFANMDATIPTLLASGGLMAAAHKDIGMPIGPETAGPDFGDKKGWATNSAFFNPSTYMKDKYKLKKQGSLSECLLKQAYDFGTGYDLPGYQQAIQATWDRPTLGVKTMRDNIWAVPGLTYDQRKGLESQLDGATYGKTSGLVSFSALASTMGPALQGAALTTGIGMLGGMQAPALRVAAAAGALGGFYSGLRKIL